MNGIRVIATGLCAAAVLFVAGHSPAQQAQLPQPPQQAEPARLQPQAEPARATPQAQPQPLAQPAVPSASTVTAPAEATGAASSSPDAHAEAAASQAVQDANNPLAPVLGFNIQNYYSPRLNQLPDSSSDAMLLRIVSPFWRLLPRATLPVTSLSTPSSTVSGLGDLQVFVAYLVTEPGSKLQVGFGPQYTAPKATDNALGAASTRSAARRSSFGATRS